MFTSFRPLSPADTTYYKHKHKTHENKLESLKDPIAKLNLSFTQNVTKPLPKRPTKTAYKTPNETRKKTAYETSNETSPKLFLLKFEEEDFRRRFVGRFVSGLFSCFVGRFVTGCASRKWLGDALRKA